MYMRSILTATVVAATFGMSDAAFAFTYNTYEHYSAANCVPDSFDRELVCDITTGSGGQTSNRLTGVVVYPSHWPMKVEVCARTLGKGPTLVTCVPKTAPAGKEVVFETNELQARFRNLTPWWNNFMYLRLTPLLGTKVSSVFDELTGYKVFWQIPKK